MFGHYRLVLLPYCSFGLARFTAGERKVFGCVEGGGGRVCCRPAACLRGRKIAYSDGEPNSRQTHSIALSCSLPLLLVLRLPL